MRIIYIVKRICGFFQFKRNSGLNRMNIGEIERQIIKKINSDEGMMIREIGAAVLSISDPLLGAAAATGNTFLNKFNDIKLRMLITQLSQHIIEPQSPVNKGSL